jgi:hypothetical protein
MDVRALVAGSRLYLPVDVPGALFSIGDLHFAQGDGEACGVAIEVSGAATLRFRVHRTRRWRPSFPAYETPPRRPRREFATTGASLDDHGRNESMDLRLATRRALLSLIAWLQGEKGLSRQAAYVLCSVAADLRLSEVVDVPNPLVSAAIPLDLFEAPGRAAVARARRRDEALAQLDLERRRESAIAPRLEHAQRDAEVWRVDAAVRARLDAGDLDALAGSGFLTREPADDVRGRLEDRVAALERDLAECRRRQEAYVRYVEALEAL